MASYDDNYLLVRLPKNYMKGAGATYASNTTLTFPAFEMRDSTDNVNIVTTDSVTLNMATNGLNGLDTGTFAASSTYYIYAVSDASNTYDSGVIASLSSTGPVFTNVTGGANYVYRLYDWWISDSSVHLIKGYTTGTSNKKTRVWDDMIKVLNDGTSATLAAVDYSPAAPVLAEMPIVIEIEFTPATADDKVTVIPGNSTATVGPNISGVVAAKKQTGQLRTLSQLVSSVPKGKYINSAASCNTDIWVAEVEYSL